MSSDTESEIIEENPKKMYSKTAVKGFSFFFATIFGGVLLYKNLKQVNKAQEAYLILLASIIYTVLTAYIVNIPDPPQRGLAYLLNLIGGYILAEYFHEKFLGPESQYEKKKVWKPLVISILVTILLIMITLFADGYI